MTPPPTTTLATPVLRSPPRPSALPGAGRSRRPLSPAKPEAVLIPPVVVYLLTIAATLVLHALLIPEPSVLTFLRVATLVALHIPALFAVRMIALGMGGSRLVAGVVPTYSALLVVLLDTLLPGHFLHAGTWALVAGMSWLSYPATKVWQAWWIGHRPARVTLLASTEWGADEAIRRLEVIPGLVVTNVVIPGCEVAAAERMLRRPVSSGPANLDDAERPLRFEKRVIVSCPVRDQGVGSLIARFVALGHAISSESAVLRAAEGRIDTDLANPLNLLLGRPRHWFGNALSRVMDVLASALLVALLLPVWILVALAIVLEDGRPVFYRQRRTGLRGRAFHVIKFRSMYRDAEARSGPVWASEDDPRITRVGRLLRRTRLDELPQLFNVFVGQMALVGPRPERPHFFEVLRRDIPLFDMRTIVRPGITGWAQVRAPYAAGPEDARCKLEYDLYYVTRRSPWFDLAILFETVGVAFSGKGAR